MKNILRMISLSLPIIYVIKQGGAANIDDLSQSLYGRGIEFRTLKSTDDFIRKEICCLNSDGVNFRYNRFASRFVKDDNLNKNVESFLGYCLKGYSNWKLYPILSN